MVREGVNRVSEKEKEKTIKKTRYISVQEMRDDLIKFLVNYNLYGRHESLRRELKVKTPFDGVTKWCKSEPSGFKEKPEEFKRKILKLMCKPKQGKTEQPCET